MDRTEEDLAFVVETARAAEGAPLGARRWRDARDGSRIIVDYTYDACSPPVALEVTTIQDDEFRQAASESEKLGRRLRRLAEREHLAPFHVVLNERAHMRGVEPALREQMRRGQGILVNRYSSDDLTASDDEEQMERVVRWHRELEALGVVEITRLPEGRETMVSLCGDSEWAPLVIFESLFAENVPKLVAAGAAYERHLVVGLAKYGISQFAGLTPVVDLPGDLDHLWVVHLWTARPDRKRSVWSLRRGDWAWREHEPVGVGP